MTQTSVSAPRLAPMIWIPGLLLATGIVGLGIAFGPRLATLALVGVAFGAVLYHAAFGFTGAWRVFISERRGRGLRAQMVMLTLAVVLFFPAPAAVSPSVWCCSRRKPAEWRLAAARSVLACYLYVTGLR